MDHVKVDVVGLQTSQGCVKSIQHELARAAEHVWPMLTPAAELRTDQHFAASVFQCLADVLLGQAPKPGLARRVHVYEMRGKLRVSGLRTEDLDLPGSVLIRRRSMPLDGERVRVLVLELFERRFPEARIQRQESNVPVMDVSTASPIFSTLISSINFFMNTS